MRDANERRTGRELSVEEIRDAEEDIIRQAQKEAFREEHEALAKGKPISNGSILSKLKSKLDEQGIIRSDSRLRYTEYLPYDVRFPVILLRVHWTTMLVVKYYHD